MGQKKGTTEDEMVGWHHRLSGHEFECICVYAYILVLEKKMQVKHDHRTNNIRIKVLKTFLKLSPKRKKY